jgi:hypothetical protein
MGACPNCRFQNDDNLDEAVDAFLEDRLVDPGDLADAFLRGELSNEDLHRMYPGLFMNTEGLIMILNYQSEAIH